MFDSEFGLTLFPLVVWLSDHHSGVFLGVYADQRDRGCLRRDAGANLGAGIFRRANADRNDASCRRALDSTGASRC